MASTSGFMDHVIEQACLGSRLRARRMFGEYALYVDDLVVGFVCDNQVFLKPTEAARARLTEVHVGYPYPGAKAHLQLNELLDEPGRLRELLLMTAAALPPPKPKATARTHTRPGSPERRRRQAPGDGAERDPSAGTGAKGGS